MKWKHEEDDLLKACEIDEKQFEAHVKKANERNAKLKDTKVSQFAEVCFDEFTKKELAMMYALEKVLNEAIEEMFEVETEY